MNYYVFNLRNLFVDNKIYFGLFDGLFELAQVEKHITLLELDCKPVNYRLQKMRGTKNKDLINKVLEYFQYKDFDFELENKYNILFSKVYYCCYYKITKQYDVLLNELQLEIEKNTILKPTLILFRVLLYTSFELGYKEINRIVKDDLDYLICFKNTNYFIKEFKLIYDSILIFYGILPEKEYPDVDKLSLSYPKISWILFFLKGSKAFLNKQYDIALANYDILINEFKSSNNLERYFMTLNNVACIYNVSKHYISSLKVTENVIEYVFSSTDDMRRVSNILMHYLFSKAMLGRYQDIIDFISIIIFDFNILNPMSAIICMVAAYKSKERILLEKLLSLNIDDPNYKLFVLYIRYKDFSCLKDIPKNPYLVRMRKVLLSKK